MPNIPGEHVSSLEDAGADTPDLTVPVDEASQPAGEQARPRPDADEEASSHPVASSAASPPSDLQTQILLELKALGEAFSLKLKYDHAKEKAIDALTEEVRRHRAGLHFAILRPLIVDLISLYDDLADLADAWRASGSAGSKTLDSFAATVEEALARQNVISFRLEQSTLDARQQRVVRTTTTDDAGLIGSVAASVRPGFMSEDRIVRPEHVIVYVPGAVEAPPPTAEAV